MKNKLITLFSIALSIQTAYAGIGDLFQKAKEAAGQVKTIAVQAKALIEPAKEYKAGASSGEKDLTPTSIEIKNKGGDIWVAIKPGTSFYQHQGKEVTKVAANTTQSFEASIAKPYEIFVWTHEPASKDATPDKRYRFMPNETAYVTADQGGSLRPQTGPAKGNLKKTDTGLSLSKNVRTVTEVEIVPPVIEEQTIKSEPVVKPMPAAQSSRAIPPAPPAPVKPVSQATTPATKPNVVAPLPTSTPERGGLLAQIREGKTLRPVEQRMPEDDKDEGQSLADMLKKSAAFKKVTSANAA